MTLDFSIIEFCAGIEIFNSELRITALAFCFKLSGIVKILYSNFCPKVNEENRINSERKILLTIKNLFFKYKEYNIYEISFFEKNFLVFGITNSSNSDMKRPKKIADFIEIQRFLSVSKKYIAPPKRNP
jgi:hypothetical protein